MQVIRKTLGARPGIRTEIALALKGKLVMQACNFSTYLLHVFFLPTSLPFYLYLFLCVNLPGVFNMMQNDIKPKESTGKSVHVPRQFYKSCLVSISVLCEKREERQWHIFSHR